MSKKQSKQNKTREHGSSNECMPNPQGIILNGNLTTAAQANVMPYTPQYITLPITQNETKKDGSVVNINPENAEFARNTVDENKK